MGNVLLLNATYEPLTILPVRRALSLLLRGRVDAVSDDYISLAGAADSLRIPTIIRLQRYVNVPRRGVAWSRRSVLRRDGYRCIYCGIRAGEMHKGQVLVRSDFTIDHIIPRSRDGKNTWGNTAAACHSCNQRKGNRTPHEAGMPLLWEPKTPRVDYLVAAGEMPTSWKLYLEV